MGLDNHLLLQSRSQLLTVFAERRDLAPRAAALDTCKSRNCGEFCTIGTKNRRRGFRESSGFSRALDCRFSDWRRRERESFCVRRSGVTVSGNAEDAARNVTQSEKCPCLYLRTSVSAGDTIRYPGNVVVLGDVQEGGVLIADGDIVVLGRLNGDVHGGRSGNKSAVVYATQLDNACQVRIGESVALVSTSQFGGCPVIVSVQDDGTLGFRAAAQKSGDSRSSSELPASAEEEATVGSKRTTSKRPAQLAMLTGVYISAVGLALLMFPMRLFGALFDVRTVAVEWIRVGAILAVVFGVYYIGTALGDMRGNSGARAFYMSTVVGRLFLFFGFSWLVAAGAAQRALFLVGTVNMLGAMSMLLALRQDSGARVLKV